MFLTRFSLFKTARPRNFTYKPMYYKPDDEGTEGQEKSSYKPGNTIRKYADEKWGRETFHTRYEQSRRKIFVLLAVILLSALIWFML
ncbi:MAG: hypothetical protein IAE67_04625 [Candidatus Competibacteraceae bacterium]|nr:hypothetical protein [Candidatus Competibacteraceae bacterium]